MEAKRIEAKPQGTRFPRRLVRAGMAAVGLTVALGSSALLAPTISAQTAANSGLAATKAQLVARQSRHAATIRSSLSPSLSTETQELIAMARKHRLGLGEVLAAEGALQNSRLGNKATSSRPYEVTSELSVVVDTDQQAAIAQNHHLGLGEVLAAERALQNARSGGVTGV